MSLDNRTGGGQNRSSPTEVTRICLQDRRVFGKLPQDTVFGPCVWTLCLDTVFLRHYYNAHHNSHTHANLLYNHVYAAEENGYQRNFLIININQIHS